MLTVWFVLTFSLFSCTAGSTHAAINANSHTFGTDSWKVNGDHGNEKHEFVKQINSDGSFVIGYEAVDGSFKFIQNVHGTYGYVNENGEIERVPHTANNTKNGLKTIPRGNKTGFSTATTQKSSSGSSPQIAIMRTFQTSSHVPKNQQQSKINDIDQDKKFGPSTTATSLESSARPSTTSSTQSVSQANKIEINERFSKVLNVNKIHKHCNDTRVDVKSIRGNTLRRQLPKDQSENFETNPQIVYSQSSDEDSVHGTQRSIFTTTISPRIPALVLAARNRAAVLKNTALKSTNPTGSSISDPSLENEYLNQMLPDKETNYNENDHYRQLKTNLPKSKEYLKGIPRQYRLPIKPKLLNHEAESGQYLRETSEPTKTVSHSLAVEHHVNNDENSEAHPIMRSLNPNNQVMYGSQQNLRTFNDQRLQQVLKFLYNVFN